jgi:hypothetical protein
MLYYRITDENRDPGAAAREMISSRSAAMLVSDKMYGSMVMAVFLPETLNRGGASYYKLDPVTLTPKFGPYREIVEKAANRQVRTETLLWEDDLPEAWSERARFHWNMWGRAPKFTDPAHAVQMLFSKVMYPETDVESHFTGRTYLEVRAEGYRRRGVTDAPMTILHRKSGLEYHFRAPAAGRVVDATEAGVALATAHGRRFLRRPKGVVAMVEPGQELETGAPLWRLAEKYKNTVAGALLTDMWHTRIFSVRGDTRYVHSQFVTAPVRVCLRCLRRCEGEECPKCTVSGMRVASIPAVSRFWIAGGKSGVFCRNVEKDFPAIPRLDDLEAIARHRRIWNRAAQNVLDKSVASVMVEK